MGSIPYSRYILYPVPWYSFLIVLGAAAAIFLACREEKHAGLKKDTVIDLALWVIPAGILGARLYYVAFSWDQFKDNLLSVFKIWEGGIAIYGALIAGFLVLILFCRKRRLPPLLLCDLLAPGLALAQSLGRWGNYFNIEAYGLQISNPVLCFFPIAVQVPVGSAYQWHLATFFYESVWDFAVFIFLMVFRKYGGRKNGDVFFLYLFLYASGRLVIEDLRLDSLYSSSVRVSQLLSVLLCIFILCLFLRRKKAGARIAFPVRCFLLPVVFLFSAYILLIMFSVSFLPVLSFRNRLLILCTYSLLMIVCLFAVYFGDSRRKKDADN